MPTVTTFEELHCAVDRYRSDKRWLFRGHASCDWKLLPKAGRTLYHGMDDRTVFQAWKRQAIAYLPNRPQDEWEWLAVAQHHGLATRLLDWSSNPLVACFFAVREPLPGDAVVYAAKFKWSVPPERKRDPMDFPDLAVFRANRIANRITSQGGMFTVHPNPKQPLSEKDAEVQGLEEIRIAEGYRATLRSQLSYYGLNDATLFPDLDGVSSYVNWTIEAQEYWRFPPSPKS